MAGILDPKKRIFDIVLTTHGRAKIKDGNFDIKYISFSDSCVDYKPDRSLDEPDQDVNNGLVQPDGLQLEAFSSPRDIIFPEIDRNGGNTSLEARIDNSFTIRKNKAYKKLGQSNTVDRFLLVTSSVDLYSSSIALTENSLSNYNNLQLIRSKESNSNLSISLSEVIFDQKFSSDSSFSVESLDPITLDTRFSNSLRLGYLPPVVNDQGTMKNIGIFPKYTGEITNQYKEYVEQQSKIWQQESIRFDKSKLTTLDIFGQVFEIAGSEVKKLIIAEIGPLYERNIPVGKLFYLGHIFRDKYDIPKFVRLFTIVTRTKNV